VTTGSPHPWTGSLETPIRKLSHDGWTIPRRERRAQGLPDSEHRGVEIAVIMSRRPPPLRKPRREIDPEGASQPGQAGRYLAPSFGLK
jgi:hypothetical protein